MAPIGLRAAMRALIEREAEHARAGRPAHIIIKNNAVADPAMIKTLYRASQAGLPIDLIVRGVCCLRPGVAGISEHIRVRSVVGRFLEHSRIYYFENGGEPEVFIGSADLMERNLDRRVEVLCPVRDPELRQHLRSVVLDSLLRDTDRAYLLQSDGTYVAAAAAGARARPASTASSSCSTRTRSRPPSRSDRALGNSQPPTSQDAVGSSSPARFSGRVDGFDFAEAEQLEPAPGVGRIGEDAGERLVDPRAQEPLVEHQPQLVAVRVGADVDRDRALGLVDQRPQRAGRRREVGRDRLEEVVGEEHRGGCPRHSEGCAS